MLFNYTKTNTKLKVPWEYKTPLRHLQHFRQVIEKKKCRKTAVSCTAKQIWRKFLNLDLDHYQTLVMFSLCHDQYFVEKSHQNPL